MPAQRLIRRPMATVAVLVVCTLTAGCSSMSSLSEISLEAMNPFTSSAPVANVNATIERTRAQYVPDGRLQLFDIKATTSDAGELRVEGVSTHAEATKALCREVSNMYPDAFCRVEVLPLQNDASAKSWGLVRVPVATLNAKPNYASSAVTQVIAGTPVRILETRGWLRVQTPDGYIAWAHRSQIKPMTAQALASWNTEDKLVVTALEARVYDATGNTIALLPAASHVKNLGRTDTNFKVMLPNDKIGFMLEHDVESLSEFRERQKSMRLNAPDTFRMHLTQTAQSLVGRSYQWADASSLSMDCSGFVQTVWKMHDVIVMRDADQQAGTGTRSSLSEALPADLLVFGKKATKDTPLTVSHVGMSLGKLEFIHALGDVHSASLMKTSPKYDAYEASRFLEVRHFDVQRFDDACFKTTATHGFYQNPPHLEGGCSPIRD